MYSSCQERMKRGGKERATPTFLIKIAIPAYSNEVTINRTKPVNYAHVKPVPTKTFEATSCKFLAALRCSFVETGFLSPV